MIKKETSIEINLGFIGKELFNTNILLFQSQFYFPWQEFFIHLVSQIVINPALLSVPKEGLNPSIGSLAANITGLPGVSSLLNSSVNANERQKNIADSCCCRRR